MAIVQASLVQDVWVGAAPRLRARRLAPFEGAALRLLFHLDRGASLDEPALAAFLEALAARIDVVALEPRGQGGSGGRLGPELGSDFQAFIESAGRRWPDGLPVLIGGHGLGASVALSLAGHPAVRGAAALAPLLAAAEDSEVQTTLESLDWGAAAHAHRPLLLIGARDRAADHASLVALAATHPHAILLTLPGNERAVLAAPWPAVVAEWAVWAARP
jgi:Serine aminopeptidase, S33